MKRHLNVFNLWVLALGLFIAVGAAAGITVFVVGLSITNLTDLVPWGLWIGMDLSSIALSAGAFLLSAAVYLLGIKRLEPVARTAVFIGITGYSMALMTLVLDIGRPDRFWHAFAFWNIHSPLWEVSMCIGLYFSVLLLETTPIVANWSWLKERWPNLASRMSHIHRFAPILAIAGLGLSMLHQSSLGAMYGVVKAKPIWFRPGLAVQFMVSAIAAGPAMTVFASMLASRLTPKAVVDDRKLETVAHFIGWALVAHLYFRFWDTLGMSYTHDPGRTEALQVLTGGELSINFWIGEILVGAVIPMILLLNGRFRRIPLVRMVALAMVVGGLVAFRWDVNMVGQLVVFNDFHSGMFTGYTTYTPSLVEILAGLGVVAYGLMVFTLGVRYLKVVDHSYVEEHVTVTEAFPAPAAAD